jgi:excinuclease ABC subunit C
MQLAWNETNDYNTLPKQPGLYVWLNDENRILYVGCTHNLYQRHQAHTWRGLVPSRVRFALGECIQTLRLLEPILIAKLKPLYNVMLFSGDRTREEKNKETTNHVYKR